MRHARAVGALTMGLGFNGSMATRRRARGTLKDPISIGYEVERASKERFDSIAESAGVSSAVFFERLVAQIEVDESTNLPVWWPKQTNEELPIDSD